MRSWSGGLREEIRDLSPGYYALVMATGIVSKAMCLDSSATLSGALLGAAIVAYVVLVVAYTWRLARYRKDFLADTRDLRRAFAFFTFVALPSACPGWSRWAVTRPGWRWLAGPQSRSRWPGRWRDGCHRGRLPGCRAAGNTSGRFPCCLG